MTTQLTDIATDNNEEEITTTENVVDTPTQADQDSGQDQGERWQEGEDLTLVRVRFPGNSRSFPFYTGKQVFSYGQKVMAMSDRGMDVGYINSFPYLTKFKKNMLPLRPIAKVATQEDIEEQRINVIKQKEAESKAHNLVKRLKLDMNITHVEITQFGKKMVFYFTAPARVDFRNLVKDLVGELKIRIELRQISVRDRAAALGSIGACGLTTCCSSFLKNYGNVSIKMAKNQNLALIPSKINGVCGQIKCCIKYEDDVYIDKRKLLPREGKILKALNGDIGKVLKLHILVEQFDMITDQGQIRRYARAQYEKENIQDTKFPERFQHVVNETSQVIGLVEVAQTMAKEFKRELSDEEQSLKNLEELKANPIVEDNGDAPQDQSTNSDENKKRRPQRKRKSRGPKNKPKD
jgi:cell fate regulator YaaT (PSP1 superfamily)